LSPRSEFPCPSGTRSREGKRLTSPIQRGQSLLFRALEEELVDGLDVDETPKIRWMDIE
jgi:hypothetical protein